MHEIDYEMFGDDMQYVEVVLDPQEATVAEAGGMMHMEDEGSVLGGLGDLLDGDNS